MSYTLAYKDRYKRVLESSIQSDTSDSVAFASIPDDVPTKLVAEWTGKQYTKLVSAVYTGANLMFPEEANEIIWQLIKVVHQPIAFELPEGSGCIEYSPSAGFISFYPDNPFIAGDKSDGWNKEAWYRWNEFDTIFPDWADNWIGGLIDFLTGYQVGDVLFNIESIPIDPIDAFLSGGGILPKIEIRFSGTGVVEVELLSFPLGGKAVVELDEEPNVLDILTGGILDAGAFIIELARDIVNFPPDEYPVVNFEYPVETAGDHVLYIVFIPILDDSLLPVGFGGGFRSVELCGFEEEAVSMGIDSVIWDGCALKTVTGGIETLVATAAEIQACMDIPASGGGSGAAITATTRKMGTAGTGTSTITSTSFVDMSGCRIFHTPTRSNMLVICENIMLLNSSTNQPITVRIVWGGGSVGLDANEAVAHNLVSLPIAVSERFAVTPNVEQALELQWKVSAGTGSRSERQTINVTILEYDNAGDLFVEDIRIFGGELQKKIGGVWLDVTDSLEAMLNAISATANSALAAASAAQLTANNAATVNAAQAGLINALDTRIDNIDIHLDDIDLSIAGINASIILHDSRLDALEAAGLGALTYGGNWYQEFDFASDNYDWDASLGWVYTSGFLQGFYKPTGITEGSISLPTKVVFDGRVTHCQLWIRSLGGSGSEINVSVNNLLVPSWGAYRIGSGGTTVNQWLKVTQNESEHNPSVRFRYLPSDVALWVTKIAFMGKGTFNPFS